jgi:nucleotide-binding universal stress UspA family protein
MRISACLGTTVLLLAVPFAPGLYAEDGLLTFVFGPSSQEAARQSAHAAAAAARHWVQTGGGVVEIRRAGNPDIKRIDKVPDAREMELTFIDTALAARDADPSSFLFTLDSAAQAAAMHSGARIVVAVLNSPPFSSDGERALEHLGEICQAHGVRVLVLDVGEGVKTVPNPALNALTAKTGGAWMRQAKSLETQVALAAPADEPAPVQAAAKAAEAAPSAPGAVLKSEIPVRIRFIRTSGTGSTSESITDHEADFGMTATLSNVNGVVGGGGGSMEVSYWPNDPNAPLQGLVTVESPLNALKFDIDDNAGSYLARARITATVRNVKGAAIWTGRRDVTVHGPMQKLNERREGSMFFMRSVTLVGQGPFSMEAKVEDLVGNTMGFIQTPVKVGRNARSLVATDAVAVRPFKGSVDKFEADQVLSYEGEALSPVLDPVFRAGQPVDLQIYLRLYPDIHGDPLDLSMDVMNEGRVVAHMSLPFKSGLANSAREGPTNGAGGTSSMVGGQAHEFPYLVNMKGAKFPAGDYQGIISIHQGKSVIKRVVAFKVVGDGTTPPVEVAKVTHTSAAADDAEIAAVVLPDIEPATIDSSGLKMRDEGQKQLWDAAAKSAMHYLDQLPNFRCIQETHRFTAPVKTPDQLKEADSYKDELIFEDGKERYQRIETDGVKADNAPVENKGISSRNEFGSLLRGLFDPDIAATYHWAGRSMTMGVLCQVFEFEVSKAKSNFVLHWGSMIEAAGYTGRVFIDDETGMVRRLTIQGTGLPKEFGLQSPSLSLDYGIVKIGRDDYLLPLRSMLQLRHAKAFVRNETVFRGYRKFEAESQIKYNN